MDLSKIEYATDNGDGNASNSQLLCDIEAISKALYLPTPPPKTSISLYHSRSKSAERTRTTRPNWNQDSGILSETVLQKTKKSLLLGNWKKPLKALAHIRQHRFKVCFFLHVHSVEGLPTNFNDVDLCVHWKRKDEVLGTHPSRVLRGTAEFDETLMHKCTVYGSRSGAHNSAKYKVKLSLICASVVGAPEADIGKHWVDLTRLLPVTLEELEGEKSSGNWITSFKLGGRAKGATLNVSFGFSLMKDNLFEIKNNMNVSSRSTTLSVKGFEMNNANKMLGRVGSVPRNLDHRSVLSSKSCDVKDYPEVSPIVGMELTKSINFLYEKLNEGNLNVLKEFDLLSEHVKQPNNQSFEFANDINDSECDYVDFTVVEKGVEMSETAQLEPKQSIVQTNDDSTVEDVNVDEIIQNDDIALEEMEFEPKANTYDKCKDLINDSKHENGTQCTKGPTIEELELALDDIFIAELTGLESPPTMGELLDQENYKETKSDYKASMIRKTSPSLDDVSESVVTDFLNMLGIDQAPFGSSFDGESGSPRERLLREFEEEALTSGDFILGFDASEHQVEFSCSASTGSGCQDSYEHFDLFPVIQGLGKMQDSAGQLLKDRMKTNILEDLETEHLMQEWGLTESAFQNSPHYCSDGFGSPIELPPEGPLEFPPLGDGFGPFVETKCGGYLRSTNPSIFRNAKNVGNLVMQVSKPVVLPAGMGSEIIDILQHLAAVGIEKFSMQLNKLMPLEDITGKTLEEVAQEAVLPDRNASLQQGSLCAQDSYPGKEEDEELQFGHTYDRMCSGLISSQKGSGGVSLRDFASSMMDRIEELSIEGLRIQCGMSDEDAPSFIGTHSIGNNSTLESKIANLTGPLSSEGAPRLHPLDVRDGPNEVDELMELSITFYEWLKLDNGIIADEDQISERTLKILAAHRANCIYLVNGTLTRYININKASGKMRGLLGSNLTVALMVLLQDPLRNFEPVGTSMLALFQMERVFVTVKPKMSDRNEGMDNETDAVEEFNEKKNEEKEVEEEEEESTPQFKFSEVHLAGLNTDLVKNQLWGNKTQKQSGTRWLLSSGMAKSIKCQLSKSKAIVISNHHGTRNLQNEDVLWSITCKIHDPATHRRGFAAMVPYIRNPDVVFQRKVSSHM